jgi:hypothetical protein
MTNQPVRILCTSLPQARAIADALSDFGAFASYIATDHGPVVMTMATLDECAAACRIVGC